MPNTQPETLLSSAEACELLNIDRSTLNRWVASGRIAPSQKLPGRTGAYLFTGSEVERARIEAAS